MVRTLEQFELVCEKTSPHVELDISPEQRADILLSLGDVVFAATSIAHNLGADLSTVLKMTTLKHMTAYHKKQAEPAADRP